VNVSLPSDLEGKESVGAIIVVGIRILPLTFIDNHNRPLIKKVRLGF
jgi:hypothetical protein